MYQTAWLRPPGLLSDTTSKTHTAQRVEAGKVYFYVKNVTVLPRHKINIDAWDACVATSRQRTLYGYAWYLDAVLPAPDWKWVGLVVVNKTGDYETVMPIPLRRKRVLGIHYSWVVHQPFFCQFLGVFSPDETIDPTPFFRVLQQSFRYCSTISLRQQPGELLLADTLRMATTHILDLSVAYDAILHNYTRDRKQNLKRALLANWTIVDAVDPEPLLELFREYHANTIDGGIADWSYTIFRNLVAALHKRNLVTLRYACRDGHIEAGALFVQEGNRIIYLFNSASHVGRRGNARTLLIDQMTREHAGKSLIFDFESPDKPSIRAFYQSFGASAEPFYEMRWSRLNAVENVFKLFQRELKRSK